MENSCFYKTQKMMASQIAAQKISLRMRAENIANE